jgi:hypothetical protein
VWFSTLVVVGICILNISLYSGFVRSKMWAATDLELLLLLLLWISTLLGEALLWSSLSQDSRGVY